MKELLYKVEDRAGIHARPAALIGQKAVNFKSQITIECNGRTADASNVIQILNLQAKYEDVLKIVFDGEDEDISITIHDISDNGISFYVPGNYEPKSQQLSISFTDTIDERIFDIQAICAISRVNKEKERTLVGCKVLGENSNYRIYELLKRLRKKNHIITQKEEEVNAEIEDTTESNVA